MCSFRCFGCLSFALKNHYQSSPAEGALARLNDYLEIANDVIKNGYKVEYPYKGEVRTGYVQLMGTNRREQAKFAFVGTNNSGNITTLHSKSGKDVWKTLNSDAKDKVIKVKND